MEPFSRAGNLAALPISLLPVLGFWLFSIGGCSSETENGYEPVFVKDSLNKGTHTIAVPSLGYYELFQPFSKYLNKHLPVDVRIQTVATHDIREYAAGFRQKSFSILLANGELALEANRSGYTIVGKLYEDSYYNGLIFTRKDSVVSYPSQLKGKTIACPGLDALAGTKMPLYFLATHGLPIQDVTIHEMNSFESVYMRVYMGRSFAGTTWSSSWNLFSAARPDIASKLSVRWSTDPLVNVALLVRNDMDTAVRRVLLDCIFNSHRNEEGRNALQKISRSYFVKADSSSYNRIRSFLSNYNSKVSPYINQ